MVLDYKAGLMVVSSPLTPQTLLAMKLALKIKIHQKLGVNSRTTPVVVKKWEGIHPSSE